MKATEQQKTRHIEQHTLFARLAGTSHLLPDWSGQPRLSIAPPPSLSPAGSAMLGGGSLLQGAVSALRPASSLPGRTTHSTYIQRPSHASTTERRSVHRRSRCATWRHPRSDAGVTSDGRRQGGLCGDRRGHPPCAARVQQARWRACGCRDAESTRAATNRGCGHCRRGPNLPSCHSRPPPWRVGGGGGAPNYSSSATAALPPPSNRGRPSQRPAPDPGRGGLGAPQPPAVAETRRRRCLLVALAAPSRRPRRAADCSCGRPSRPTDGASDVGRAPRTRDAAIAATTATVSVSAGTTCWRIQEAAAALAAGGWCGREGEEGA